MQQTENLKLNLIEGADAVDWEVLNENMEKVESQFGAVAGTLAEHAANLGTGGKTCRIAWGSYTGSGKYGSANPNSLTFDFKPVVVILAQGNYTGMLVRDCELGNNTLGGGVKLTWTDHGVSWYTEVTQNQAQSQDNKAGTTYYYVALGVSA